MQILGRFLGMAAGFLMVLASATAATSDGHFRGWITEPGVEPPSYAVTEPTDSNLNVDVVVLLCTELAGRRSLELDLYLTDEGRLAPRGADPQALKDDPRVELAIDGRVFPAQLLFADDYAVVADSTDSTQGQALQVPTLSSGLLDAMQRGEKMTMRFDLLDRPAGEPARFDSELVVDLASGRSAIAAVRRCAQHGGQHQVAR
ncbi:MAG: hypothetical protein JSS04_10675 [Proteobacteria bacterium]|nr:hypothetical protein [Pseudomonadota bacterium]